MDGLEIKLPGAAKAAMPKLITITNVKQIAITFFIWNLSFL